MACAGCQGYYGGRLGWRDQSRVQLRQIGSLDQETKVGAEICYASFLGSSNFGP